MSIKSETGVLHQKFHSGCHIIDAKKEICVRGFLEPNLPACLVPGAYVLRRSTAVPAVRAGRMPVLRLGTLATVGPSGGV